MILKVVSSVLILFAVSMGVKQGFAMASVKPEMLEMFGKWNFSREGVMAKDYVNNLVATTPASEEELQSIHRRLIYRHIAWLTALRFQLRQPRAWENLDKPHAKEYRKFYSVPEWETKLEEELQPFLSSSDLEYVLKKKNYASIVYPYKTISEFGMFYPKYRWF